MSEMTRRKFLKRSGAATAAAIIGASFVANEAKAAEEEGGGSSMICSIEPVAELTLIGQTTGSDFTIVISY